MRSRRRWIWRAVLLITVGLVALVMLVEVVLAPLWVWLGVGETPSAGTLIGGAIVLAAVLAQTLSGLRAAPT